LASTPPSRPTSTDQTEEERLRRLVRAVAVLHARRLRTQSVQLELVAHQLEPAEPVRHLVLQLLDGVVLELEDEPAVDADEMVVVAVAFAHHLVARLPVAELARRGDAGI